VGIRSATESHARAKARKSWEALLDFMAEVTSVRVVFIVGTCPSTTRAGTTSNSFLAKRLSTSCFGDVFTLFQPGDITFSRPTAVSFFILWITPEPAILC
jgi:hypothetical protein